MPRPLLLCSTWFESFVLGYLAWSHGFALWVPEGPGNSLVPEVLISCLSLFGANLAGWFLPKGVLVVHTQIPLRAGPTPGGETWGIRFRMA